MTSKQPKKFTIGNLFYWGSVLPPQSSFRGGQPVLFILWFLIVYTILSGVARKWITGPGAASNFIFFIQLLLPALLYVVVSQTRLKSGFKMPWLFGLFILYMIVCALNPKNQTYFHGIFGLVIHLAFWLGLVTYYKWKQYFELEKFVGLIVLILVGEVILASVQYALPGDHVLNRFSTGEENTSFVGSAVRVAGTFSFIGGFQAWVTLYGFLIWFLIVLEFPSVLIISVFVLSLFAGFVCGGRGSVGYLTITTLFSFIITGFLGKNFINIIVSLLFLGSMIYFFGGDLVKRFDVAYDNFASRVEQGNETGEVETRLIGSFTEIIDFRGNYPIYGIGLGSTYQGANILFGESVYAKEYGYYESEAGRIVLEGGYILFFLRIILFIVLLQYSSIPPIGKWFMFILFVNNMIIFNIYLGIFFFLGFIFVDRAYYLKKNSHAAVSI